MKLKEIFDVTLLAVFLFFIFSTLAGVCVIENGNYVVGGIITGVSGLAVGGVIVYVLIKKTSIEKMAKLKLWGKRLQGTIQNFGQDRSIKVDGEYPYIVSCVYVDEFGQEQKYKSKRLWEDPELNLCVGELINIYVDRNDSRKYFVDVEEAIVQAGKRRLVEYAQCK